MKREPDMTANDHVTEPARKPGRRLGQGVWSNDSRCQSCTAGARSTIIATTPGAGDVLQGGIVAYSKTCKTVLLGLPTALIEKSAVTEDVARAMASGALGCSCANTAVAVTSSLVLNPTRTATLSGLRISP